MSGKVEINPVLLVRITDPALISEFYAWTMHEKILPLDGTLYAGPGAFQAAFDFADMRPIKAWFKARGRFTS